MGRMHGNHGVLIMEVGAAASVRVAVATRCPCTNKFVLAKRLLAQMQTFDGKYQKRLRLASAVHLPKVRCHYLNDTPSAESQQLNFMLSLTKIVFSNTQSVGCLSSAAACLF